MTYFLTLSQILLIHQRLIQQSGGTPGLRDFAALESAVAQPKMTFDKNELYPTLGDKAAALGYSLIKNHPFIDGNKRICHAAMMASSVPPEKQLASVEEMMLKLTGIDITVCPFCNKGKMQLVVEIPKRRAPPSNRLAWAAA